MILIPKKAKTNMSNILKIKSYINLISKALLLNWV